jgi:hypothetical protein
MRIAALIMGAALAAFTISAASAAVRIKADSGGQIGPYLEALVALRGSGEKVIIDGPCLSACTMVLGVIPRERICVTPRAQLGFHAAWHPTPKGPVTSQAGTKLLWDMYPEHVRTWITGHGGLTRKLLVLSGPDLAAMYSPCTEPNQVATAARKNRPAASAEKPPSAAVSAMAR